MTKAAWVGETSSSNFAVLSAVGFVRLALALTGAIDQVSRGDTDVYGLVAASGPNLTTIGGSNRCLPSATSSFWP